MAYFDQLLGGGQQGGSAFAPSSTGMSPSSLAMLLAMQNRALAPTGGMMPPGPPAIPGPPQPPATNVSAPNLGAGGPVSAPNMMQNLPQMLQLQQMLKGLGVSDGSNLLASLFGGGAGPNGTALSDGQAGMGMGSWSPRI